MTEKPDRTDDASFWNAFLRSKLLYVKMIDFFKSWDKMKQGKHVFKGKKEIGLIWPRLDLSCGQIRNECHHRTLRTKSPIKHASCCIYAKILFCDVFYPDVDLDPHLV